MLKVWKKSWEPFRIYQLTSTANPAEFTKSWPNWLCYLAGRSKRVPTIFFILSALLCIINKVSKLASPLRSNFVMLISDSLGGVFLLLFHMQHFSFLECSSPLGQIICHHSLTHIACKVVLIKSCGGLFLLLWDLGHTANIYSFLLCPVSTVVLLYGLHLIPYAFQGRSYSKKTVISFTIIQLYLEQQLNVNHTVRLQWKVGHN